MKTKTVSVRSGGDWTSDLNSIQQDHPQVIFIFGALSLFKNGEAQRLSDELSNAHSQIFGCSTAGEISGTSVDDDSLSVLSMHFETEGAHIAWSETDVVASYDSFDSGKRLAQGLPSEGLRHVLILAPGTDVNGSALIDGARKFLPSSCTLSGGLAGDAATFTGTYQLSPQGAGQKKAIIVGFYGAQLDVRCACQGGWKPFGPARKATKSSGNILYELDGEPALAVYKKYLGTYAAELPSSGLLFPFETRSSQKELTGIIRTILGVDDTTGSLILAGEIEQGGYLTLMHASTDSLTDGAYGAVKELGHLPSGPKAIIAISCVGRKLVMGARAEEEAEALSEIAGPDASISGFYSNGEICGDTLLSCSLHNQTMTITCFSEI